VAKRDMQKRMAKEESLTMSADDQTAEPKVQIRRAPVDSLILYDVTEDELELLATGSPSGLHLNFGIFLLSVASSLLISILTTQIESARVFTVFVVIVVVGFIAGGYMMFSWHRAHKSTRDVIKRIRDRLPQEESAITGGKGKKKGGRKAIDQKGSSKTQIPNQTEAELGQGEKEQEGG
jgi:hypothetical protein